MQLSSSQHWVASLQICAATSHLIVEPLYSFKRNDSSCLIVSLYLFYSEAAANVYNFHRGIYSIYFTEN